MIDYSNDKNVCSEKAVDKATFQMFWKEWKWLFIGYLLGQAHSA